MPSYIEENYLKAILHLTSISDKEEAGVSGLAAQLGVRPATASVMLTRLVEKELVNFEKYGKVSLTSAGQAIAIEVVRKHRLWETFLCDKLGFSWDEVHEVAEQLEHVQSPKLTERLDVFLGRPTKDPHGDPIPGPNGEMNPVRRLSLTSIEVGASCNVVAVADDSPAFLKYVDGYGLHLGALLTVAARHPFDQVMELKINENTVTVSQKLAENIYVTVL